MKPHCQSDFNDRTPRTRQLLFKVFYGGGGGLKTTNNNNKNPKRHRKY